MSDTWTSVPVHTRMSRTEFVRQYVNRERPVVLRGVTDDWQARRWSVQSLRMDGLRYGDSSPLLMVKQGNVAEGRQVPMTLTEYSARLEAHIIDGEESPGYLHDVPIFRYFPVMKRDVDPFPTDLLPAWYRDQWWEYAQFFMGPGGSKTPLHYDTLLTHNLFFHLSGQKRWRLIPYGQAGLCKMRDWRWSDFDPADPDYDRCPEAEAATIVTVDLEPGDVLFLPSGTLHQVENLTPTIAFNIDWHTAASARRGVLSVLKGAPVKNGYYNLLALLGVGMGVPARFIFPLYRSYLTYVS